MGTVLPAEWDACFGVRSIACRAQTLLHESHSWAATPFTSSLHPLASLPAAGGSAPVRQRRYCARHPACHAAGRAPPLRPPASGWPPPAGMPTWFVGGGRRISRVCGQGCVVRFLAAQLPLTIQEVLGSMQQSTHYRSPIPLAAQRLQPPLHIRKVSLQQGQRRWH